MVTLPKASLIIIVFTTDFQLLLPYLRRLGFLWLLLKILNYYYPVKSGLDFYDFHCKISMIVTLLEKGLIFMSFNINFQLLSPVIFYGFYCSFSIIVIPLEVE